jgi:ParB family chromosome partitioning protein
MELKNLPITKCYESPTNPRGTKFEGPEFDELVASIKEKGVLMPVLAREVEGKFEVVAGSRRLRAATKAGLKEIPAKVAVLTDTEAQEAQIVENLQRADVHPLEEGEAYRKLIEQSSPRYDIRDVAAKVGKSESYIRQRLGLTNLSPEAKTAFRKEEITAGQAVVIARLDGKHQEEALSKALYSGYSAYQLRRWAYETVYADLANRPWKDDAELSALVGDTGAKPTLFNPNSIEADPVDYARQMSAYIEITIRKSREKGVELVKVADVHGKPETKGALVPSQYTVLETVKERNKAKDARKAIIVEGHGIGKIIWISTAKNQPGKTNYEQTKREKEKAEAEKKEREAQAARDEAKFVKAIERVKWPMTANQLDALVKHVVAEIGYNQDEIALRLGLTENQDIDSNDALSLILKHLKTATNTVKAQVLVEVIAREVWELDRDKFLKQL